MDLFNGCILVVSRSYDWRGGGVMNRCDITTAEVPGS